MTERAVNLTNVQFAKQFIHRQYNDRWRFPDYNVLIQNMQCKQVFSFCNYPVQTELQNYDVPISTCKFSNKCKDILAVANENGVVRIQNVNNFKECKFVQTHKNTVYDIAWMPDSTQFVTVSGDNSAKLWDCGESDVNLISVFQGHKRSVRCVSFKPENTAVFATGSRDGSLMIWDARAKKKCAKFSHHLPDQIIPTGAGSPQWGPKFGAKKSSHSVELPNCKSVTGLVFQNDNTLISCGSLDNVIRVWDMRKTYSRSASNTIAKYQLQSPYSGFSYLCMDPTGSKLYANCMDSYIYCFNINSYDSEPIAAFYGHENGSFYVKSSLSYDGKYLLSGSSDEIAYIWNTRRAEMSEVAVRPFVTLSSHLAEVSCVEMSPNSLVIATCSDDGTFRLWNTLHDTRDSGDVKRDSAAYYTADSVSTVKTQWRNKRKLDVSDECDEGSAHRKICRFYTSTHSSPCICKGESVPRLGVKRLSGESPNGENPSKRRALMLSQEQTPPQHPNGSRAVQFDGGDVTPESVGHETTGHRLSSKRKLEDMPGFIEECNKSQKLVCHRVLVPSNCPINRERVLSPNPDEPGRRCSKSCGVRRVTRVTSLDEEEDVGGGGTGTVTGVSSPTSNLPNYVEDGTSPYIHSCRKTGQKENDWLTKLQEKRRKADSGKEKKPNGGASPLTASQEKKKLKFSSDHTLHRYFKVSSKSADKNSVGLQEIQKKSILIN